MLEYDIYFMFLTVVENVAFLLCLVKINNLYLYIYLYDKLLLTNNYFQIIFNRISVDLWAIMLYY